MEEVHKKASRLLDEIRKHAQKARRLSKDEAAKHLAEAKRKTDEVSKLFDPTSKGEDGNPIHDAESRKILERLNHEVNSPLQLITGSLDTLSFVEGEKRDRYFDLIDSTVDTIKNRASYIFNPIELSPQDLNELILGLHENGSLKPEGYGHVNLELELDKNAGTLEMDKGKMELVLQNIVKNACEAGAKNIKITTLRKKNVLDYSFIRIWNDNSVIPEGKEKEIFMHKATFSEGKKPGIKGTGIGLATAKDYVEQHAGKITVGSDREKNHTTFEIRLPHGRRGERIA